jgi:cyclophilin family peptidyl-prolyl cis-trans isomerase
VHTVFGQVTEGIDVVQKIGPNDVMTSVRVTDAD